MHYQVGRGPFQPALENSMLGRSCVCPETPLPPKSTNAAPLASNTAKVTEANNRMLFLILVTLP